MDNIVRGFFTVRLNHATNRKRIMSKKSRKFKTEVQQLLNLVIHSLYSKKEIFLRELISNASDAIDRIRFEGLTNKAISQEESAYKIKLTPNAEARTLTISDNGIGMTQEEVEKNIGTIANSGTRAFLESLSEADKTNPEFIGQFGVGFYSAFMVADKVVVETRRAGSDGGGIRWTSAGEGNYTLEDIEKESPGTDIILHLREDQTEFTDEWRLRQVVKEYSDYIAFPVVMDVTRKEKPKDENGEEGEEIEVTAEETLNSQKAIWKKDKADISDEEYHEFYRHVSHDYTEPLETIHYVAEGATEFRALVYLPAQPPMDMFIQKDGYGPQLYVKNVQIMDHCADLLPEYLRFVKGVVDSSDLPLNVSREMLQDDAVIRRIKKSLVAKILSTLKSMMEKRPEDYRKFYAAFGKILKEGAHFDFENKEKLVDLLLYSSTATEGDDLATLRDYRDRMPEEQKAIYYLTGDDLSILRDTPYLEAFKKKGYEVLFMADPIDEWVVQSVTQYDDIPLKAIDKGEIDLDGEDKEEEREEEKKTFEGLIGHIKETLSEDLSDVRLSRRLSDSACCLVHDEHGMNANMERIMRAMNQEVPPSKKILELNPDHELVKRMNTLAGVEEHKEQLQSFVDLLYGQAQLTSGAEVKNPGHFSQLVSELMLKASN